MSESSNAVTSTSRPQGSTESDVHCITVAVDPAECEEPALESKASVNCSSSRVSADVDTNPEKYAVLTVECIEAKALKVHTVHCLPSLDWKALVWMGDADKLTCAGIHHCPLLCSDPVSRCMGRCFCFQFHSTFRHL